MAGISSTTEGFKSLFSDEASGIRSCDTRWLNVQASDVFFSIYWRLEDFSELVAEFVPAARHPQVVSTDIR